MVNGNYVLYGDRPSSESEIVDDHVQTRTAERKNKRKSNRTANELQRTLNMAQLDNETDSVKYEKKIKEPRLLRYVPTTEVEENFVSEKFESYDLKPTEERPRRYAFQKKPKNPADGSVNYAYSRSSSSCSSPNGNLPTISEHGEQYGTYRVHSLPSPTVNDIMNGYENKLEKYFTKPRELKKCTPKVNYEGSHPDSLYRVPAGGGGVDKMAKMLRLLRWPVALVAVCIALAVFVYFLMPENLELDLSTINETYWEPVTAAAEGQSHGTHSTQGNLGQKHLTRTKKPEITQHNHGMKTPEIDFYDTETDRNVDYTSIIDTITDASPHRVLPIQPVFPTHITPEVQYGNERADSEKLRTPKVLNEANDLPDDSTLKPHITQKPEKPLAVYFKDANAAAETTTTREAITGAATVNEFGTYGDKTNKKFDVPKIYSRKDQVQTPKVKPVNIKQYLVTEPEFPPEVQEYYSRQPANVDVNFTSGHSKLFGISIEDAEKMRSTTQTSLYNTRVSPTLPTWRDGDDATTKKYPVYANFDVPQCRSTRLPLCRGVLPYDLAGSPATVGGGLEVTSLLPQIEYLVATNCSARMRHFTCALLEPECNPPPYPPKKPCYNLCKAIVDNCDGFIPRDLLPVFNCEKYSRNNCVGAKSPCYKREFTCGDGTCIPKDWICDGTQDCIGGDDEASCISCDQKEYRCKSGVCIQKQWLCDGYADCPEGEDETESCDRHVAGEPGEELAGSAPAPAVRRPHRLQAAAATRTTSLHKARENDNSKELLETSDSNNAFKRNFTRRPSLSRLTPYSRPVPQGNPKLGTVPIRKFGAKKSDTLRTTNRPEDNTEVSGEDVNLGDIGFFEDFTKTPKDQSDTKGEELEEGGKKSPTWKAAPTRDSPSFPITRLDKTINKLEKVINGAALLKKVQEEENIDIADSLETNGTAIEKEEELMNIPVNSTAESPSQGSISAHVSPCPSGELRCVDGRCITLAQLCDGTIDCTDHADEDNCYT